MSGKRYRTLSLRAAMVLLTIACIAAAAFANSLREQAELIAKIRASGGRVMFQSDLDPNQSGIRLAKLLGEDLAGEVGCVSLMPNTSPEIRHEVNRRGWTNLIILLCPSHPPGQRQTPNR